MKKIISFCLIFLTNFIFSQTDTTKTTVISNDSIKVIKTEVESQAVIIDTLHVKKQNIQQDSIKLAQEKEAFLKDSLKKVALFNLNIKIKTADSAFLTKKYVDAKNLYGLAKSYNDTVSKDEASGFKIIDRMYEIDGILLCYKNIDSAQRLFNIERYDEALLLMEKCKAFDTISLTSKIEFEIKRIKDSIQFEAFITQAKEETDAKEYKKSLLTLEKAKALKTTLFLETLEEKNKKIVAEIDVKNLKRQQDFKTISDKFIAYQKMEDTLKLKLNDIKEKYGNKFDTCVGYVKSQYKELLAQVKAHPDFDATKNDFKITDYWDEVDEAILKPLEELDTKTKAYFKFVDIIQKAVASGDKGTLRNFTKYVYVKDIVYVFMLEK